MSIKRTFENKEVWILVSIFIFFGLIYISQLTSSGLWYDEAIEYFYSKYMTGSVPVNPVDQTGNNMYERICITYQPPLYNILMFFWLQLFDSESGFRLAGVITTFIGSLGFYLAIRRIAGYKWGAMGLSLYLSTAAIAYYALECGEYNLMLCMECWMLYFYTTCAQSQQDIASWHSLIGFFIFASLSVYSQYGAAFIIIGLSFSLCYLFVKSKNYISFYRLIILGIATIIVSIIPLYIFFISIQMGNQGSSSVTHSPVFVGNVLGGIPYSLYKSFHEHIKWVFSSSLAFSWFSVKIMQITVYGIIAITFISMYLKSKLSIMSSSIIASFVCYIVFFILSACSFYAYNWWDGHLGCYNIINYKRYVLFFVPLLLFTISIGLINILKRLHNNKYRLSIVCVFIVLAIFIFNLSFCLYNRKMKSDVREITLEWLEKKDSDHKMVVQGACAPQFMYYIQHSSDNNEKMLDNIIITKQEMNTEKKVECHLRELSIFDLSEFYFIGHDHAWNMKGNGIHYICNLFTSEGYHIEFLRAQETTLLFMRKDNHSK